MNSIILNFRHTLSAPSSKNRYISDLFPFLTNSITLYDKSPGLDMLENVKMQLSIVIYSINSATSILKEPIEFDRS